MRSVLYMATLSAKKWDPTISAFYHHLIAAGKKPKVALLACMNKLLRIFNAVTKSNQPWQPDYSYPQSFQHSCSRLVRQKNPSVSKYGF